MSGHPLHHANLSRGRATPQGAATFQVAEPTGDDATRSVSSIFSEVEGRLDCSRRGVGTPNARSSQPTEEGLVLNAASDDAASDKPMPSRSPSPFDVEMPSRSSTPSDDEMRSKSPSPIDYDMEDLSMEFRWLFHEGPGQDEEMEDLTVDFSLLFDVTESSSRHDSLIRIEGGSKPVSTLVSGTGEAETHVNEATSQLNASFWSGNTTTVDNIAVGPGSPMDFDDTEKSTPVSVIPVPATASDNIIATDASTTAEASKEVKKPDPTKNADHDLNDISERAKSSSPIPSDSSSSVVSSIAHEADLTQPLPSVVEVTVDNTANPVLAEAAPPTAANATNNLIDEVQQLSLPTINSELASIKNQISVWQQLGFTFKVDPKPKQLPVKHTIARTSTDEPPYKVRVLTNRKPKPVAESEAENENAGIDANVMNEVENAVEVEVPDVPTNQQPMPSPPHADQNVEEADGPEEEVAEDGSDSDSSSAVSIASMEVGFDELSEVDLDALLEDEAGELSEEDWNSSIEVTESEAESITTAQYLQNLNDEYDAAEDEEEWRNADLPDDDDENAVYVPVEESPVPKLIDTDDNASSDEGEVEEGGNGNNVVPDQAPSTPSSAVSTGTPPRSLARRSETPEEEEDKRKKVEKKVLQHLLSDDDVAISSADDQSGDEEVDEGEPERETTPSIAPSTRPSTPVASANGSTPPTSPNNNGAAGNNNDEPEVVDVPPMDDIDRSDATDHSDAESTESATEDEPMEVDEPELPVAAPKAINPVDPWKEVRPVKNFRTATLPAPHDVVVQDEEEWYVQEFDALTPQMLQQEVRGKSYIAGLYAGKVVFQGTFEGVPLSSALMSMAAVSPQVIFNDPTEPIIKLAGGRDHLVMLGLSGRLYTLGRVNEGQLGQDPSRHRYRNPTPLNMRRRVLEKLEYTASGRVKSRTPEIFFDRIEAHGNMTIAWSEDRVFRCGTSEDGSICSSTFKELDRRV